MRSPVRELKVRAEILHHQLQALGPPVLVEGAPLPAPLTRLRSLPELRGASEAAVREAAGRIQRKHCLAVVARELGFASFEHARRVLEGDEAEADFGTLLYGKGSGAYLNHWFANHAEARAQQVETEGAGPRQYLLAYKRHCFLAERGFVEALGFDADNPDWAGIGWDWVRPRDAEARQRLYARRLLSLREGAAA